MVAQSGGFMYSSTFAPHVRWEITTADPRSNKVCVRYQSRVFWINKPWVTWRVIEKNAYNHLHELSNNLEKFVQESAPKYLGCADLDYDYTCHSAKIPRTSQGGVVSDGLIGELRTTSTDERGNLHEQLAFRADFRTSGTPLDDGMLVQNYIQWRDLEEPGKYFTMYCNAVYDRKSK